MEKSQIKQIQTLCLKVRLIACFHLLFFSESTNETILKCTSALIALTKGNRSH